MSTPIYLVTMQRWGDSENHHYSLGAYSTFKQALLDGYYNGKMWRDNKYEPLIQMTYIDSNDTLLTMCRYTDDAFTLIKEICTQEEIDKLNE